MRLRDTRPGAHRHRTVPHPQQARTLAGRVMVDTAPQSTAERGYAASDSRVDWDAQIVTCPQGKRGHRWSVENNRHGHPIVRIRFSVQDRGPCPVRELCIRPGSHGRTLTLLSRAEDEALTSARCEQK